MKIVFSWVFVLLIMPVAADVLRPGVALPACDLVGLSDGKLVDLADVQKGKKRVVHLFASW